VQTQFYSDSWDDADKQTAGGGRWLRLGDGDLVDVILASPPLSRSTHGFGKTSRLCPGDRCSICSGGDDAKVKVAFVVLDVESAQLRVLDLSAAGYRPIKALGRAEAQRSVLRLSRIGSGFNCRYDARVMRAVTDGDRTAIARAQQIDLHKLVIGDTPIATQLPPSSSEEDDDIPFDRRA
jgi:hypothetical protein